METICPPACMVMVMWRLPCHRKRYVPQLVWLCGDYHGNCMSPSLYGYGYVEVAMPKKTVTPACMVMWRLPWKLYVHQLVSLHGDYHGNCMFPSLSGHVVIVMAKETVAGGKQPLM